MVKNIVSGHGVPSVGENTWQNPKNKERPRDCSRGLYNNSGNVLLSHTIARVVPSALEGLTAEFGMGSGVTPPLWSPEVSKRNDKRKSADGHCIGCRLIGAPDVDRVQ